MTDLGFAVGHHLAVFTLVAIIAAEFALIRPGLSGAGLHRAAKLDAAYGICAVIVIAVGVARLIFGIKGADFYLSNPWFWAKMAAFAAIGVLSIMPTIALIKWRRMLKIEPRFAPTVEAIARLRSVIFAELVLVPIVLVCAAATARYGTF